MLTSIQLFLLLFILFAISRVYLRLREKVLPPKAAFFWFLIWFSALIGILLPATTSRIASFFGVGRGVDIIVYISLAVGFYLIFRIYVVIEDIKNEITFLVRQIALNNPHKPKIKRKK